MQLINGWKGEIRYEEGAATGMHNDVSGNGKGFWGMMDGMIKRASFFYVLSTESQFEIRKAKESYSRARGKDSRCECRLVLHI